MARKKFRWTRASYYHAQHLSRLLLRMNCNATWLVDEFLLLMDGIGGRDPLTLPLAWRYDRDDIPF